MKLRRLPETDLARIAPLSRDEKRIQLRSFNTGGGSWSYDPARAQNFNIANPRNPLAMESTAPTLKRIEKIIESACYCEPQKNSCIEVVQLFHDWYNRNATDAIERKIPSMGIGSLGVVRYWENFVSVINDKPTFLFLDYRRQKGLTNIGRKFVFSMIKEQVRAVDPDFSNPEALILRFPQAKGSPRRIVDHYASDLELFDLEQLTSMIEETYDIWREVLDERRAEPPKRAAGGLL